MSVVVGQSLEVDLEHGQRAYRAYKMLRALGVTDVHTIHQCWTEAESDLDGDVVLFLTAWQEPFTAVVKGDSVSVTPGW